MFTNLPGSLFRKTGRGDCGPLPEPPAEPRRSADGEPNLKQSVRKTPSGISFVPADRRTEGSKPIRCAGNCLRLLIDISVLAIFSVIVKHKTRCLRIRFAPIVRITDRLPKCRNRRLKRPYILREGFITRPGRRHRRIMPGFGTRCRLWLRIRFLLPARLTAVDNLFCPVFYFSQTFLKILCGNIAHV